MTALRHDGGGPGEVRFVPDIPEEGAYDVYLYWPRSEALSSAVPVVVRHAEGVDTLTVDMLGAGGDGTPGEWPGSFGHLLPVSSISTNGTGPPRS